MAISVSIDVSVPSLLLQSSVIRNNIFQALQTETGPQMMKLFKPTVQGWSRPPAFLQSGHSWLSEVAVRVYTRGEVYRYVNSGTPPHRIEPRRARMLRFQPGYRAGTRPRVLSSSKPQRFGDYISAGAVNHPGIQARDFDKEVAERVFPEFVDTVNRAIGLSIKFVG